MRVPTVSPTGLLALVVSKTRSALAASASFQALVVAADATEALDSIYFDYISQQDENELTSVAPMPRAIVRLNDKSTLELLTVDSCESSGTVQVILESTVPEDYQQASDDSAADRKAKIDAEVLWWLNTISGIPKEMQVASMSGGQLVPWDVDIVQGRVHPEDNNGVPYRWAEFVVTWRGQGN